MIYSKYTNAADLTSWLYFIVNILLRIVILEKKPIEVI